LERGRLDLLVVYGAEHAKNYLDIGQLQRKAISGDFLTVDDYAEDWGRWHY
jgi:hypothetical protein